MPQSSSPSRRQFLAMTSSAALIAGVPWPARANINTQNAYGLAPEGAAVARSEQPRSAAPQRDPQPSPKNPITPHSSQHPVVLNLLGSIA